MSRNGRPVLILASVCALLAALFAYLHLSRGAPEEVRTEARVPVLVASQELLAGTIIEPGMVATRDHPPSRLPHTALRYPAQVVGKVAARPVSSGEVLTQETVVPASAALGPAYVLSREMRAVTVSADLVSGLAGFLKPGDRVDVFATFTRGQESITRVVLQDTEIVAVGNATRPDSPAPGADTSRAVSGGRDVPVTLAVTVPEAERLILADTRGKIRLALRPAVGGNYPISRGVTETQVSGLGNLFAAGRVAPKVTVASAPVAPAPDPRALYPPGFWPGGAPRPAAATGASPKPAQEQVVVVRGTKVETVTVGSPDAAR